MSCHIIEQHMEKLRYNPELWDLFTKREEYNPKFRDQYQRFPYYLSKDRTVFEPMVSKNLLKNGLCITYSEEKEFAVCLTHDIDSVYYPSGANIITGMGAYLIKGQLIESLKRPFYNYYKNWNPTWNFNKIMDLEEEYGASSTFFIMGLQKNDRDFNYFVDNLHWDLGNILDRGWEVGLHGGHNAYNNIDSLINQKTNLENALGKDVISYRNHFLRFQVPETWDILEKAGFKYDTTFGYADCIGFRNGMCHPYQPFNLNINKFMNICEIPLTIMDGTLFNSYMRLTIADAWNLLKNHIDILKRYSGTISILWHNSFFKGDYLKLYKKLLNYIVNNNGHLCKINDVHKVIQITDR